jgi:hypothetical protein
MSVYFIQRGKDGPIKIGAAENFFTRYKALQSYIAEPLYVRAVIDGDKSTERKYHYKFDRYRLHRKEEWFSPADEIISFTRMVRPTVLEALWRMRASMSGLEMPINLIIC